MEVRTVKPGEAPILSIVIPCLNVGNFLGDQLAALSKQQCSCSWEVVIVDNGSNDNTVAVAESFRTRLPSLKITQEKQRGRHYACNRGVQVSHGKYVVFVDGDDEVQPGFVQAMIQALDCWPVVGGKLDHHRNGNNSSVSFGSVQTDRLMDGFGFRPFAAGGCFGIHKDVFESIGGFHAKDYCEDADISWRLQLAGYQIQFVPEASISNRQRANLKQMFRQHQNYGQARAMLYKDYRRYGMQRRSISEAFSEWFGLIRSIPMLNTFDRKARWIRRLAKCCGQLRGSIKYKVFFP